MRITIDGQICEAADGQTILEVARAHGIHIPTLCWHPRIGPSGRCRACLVEVEGWWGLKESCGIQASDGMVVATDTPAVLEARRAAVELLAEGGRHDCDTCHVTGACQLEDLAIELGMDVPAPHPAQPVLPVDDSSPGIVHDPNLCILCGLCVEACNRTVCNDVLGYRGRSADTEIICDQAVPMGFSTCTQCGECVQMCPVGALSARSTVEQGVDGSTETTRVTCPFCGVGCQVDLETKDNRIVASHGREEAWADMPNRGMLCVKGRFGLEFVHAEDRLKTPLIRRNGVLEEASWEEALDYTAAKLEDIKAEHGPDAIGFFSSAKVTNEENYALTRFARAVIGTNNVDHCARL